MSAAIRVEGSLQELLKERKFAFKPTFDARLSRFDRNGKILSAWSVGKTIESPGGQIQMLIFGDFATGEKYEWWSRKALTKAEAESLEQAAKEERKKYQVAKRQRQKEAAKECQEFWDGLASEGDPTGYCSSKGLHSLHGGRCDEGENLYLPIHATNGTLLNLQRIEADGTKRFWPGGAIRGNVIFIDGYPETSPETIYLAEGYSTGASIAEALRQGSSTPLHSEQNVDGSLLRDSTDSGDRGSDLPGLREVARGSASHPPQDGGIPKAPRSDGQRSSSDSRASHHDGQRGQNPRDDHRSRLEHQLLAALTPIHTQRGQDERARPRGAQSLHAGQSQAGDAARFNQGGLTRFTGTPGDDAGCGLERTSKSSGNFTNRLRGQDGSADSAARGQEPHGGKPIQCAADKRGAKAIPLGDGADPRGLETRAQHSSFTRGDRPAYSVACALNSGNLLHAARALRKRWPAAELVICADNDRWSTRPDVAGNLGLYNPGLECALEASADVEGSVVVPIFSPSELGERPTDFNDLSLLHDGHHRILASLAMDPKLAGNILTEQYALTETPPTTAKGEVVTTTRSPLMSYDRKGNPTLPSPQAMANYLLDAFPGLIVKQEHDLFKYKGTHWRHLDRHGLDDLYMVMQELCDNLCTPDKLKEYTEMLRISAPAVPPGRNIFASDPHTANFLNGTLHVIRNCTRYYTEFRPHNPRDYLINVLPYEWAPAHDLPINDAFEGMLERIFAGDRDWREKRRAVAQMFGACLAPLSPHLFMLFGPPGTGKSTLIKLAARLMHKDNTCSVDPSEFEEFNMAIMAGKLVNYVTDIDITTPIRDAIIKRIEDREEMTIRRKRKDDLRAPLPAVHIFGGNDIPPTLEGASRAHSRRWTFLKFSQVVAVGQFDKDFADNLFKQGPLGVLRFALEGLEDLCAASGHFVQPASGAAAMEEWQLENDPVGEFIERIKGDDFADQGTRIYVDKDGQVIRSQLYEIFKMSMTATRPQMRVLPASKFYKRLEALGFVQRRTLYNRFIVGLSVGPGTVSQM